MTVMETIPAGAGDFAALVREHQAMVYSIAWHFLHDRALAEEVAQEVFFNLHRNLDTVESPAHAQAWLRKATVRRSIDEGRRRQRRFTVSLENVPEPSMKASPGDPLLGELLRKMVASLSATPRMIVILRYQEELEPAEIAALVEMPLSTVKSHLARSLALLREKLERRGMGPGRGGGEEA